MANDYTGRIWKVTQNGTTPFGTANVKFGGGTWTGMSTDAVFNITDAAGRVYTWAALPTGQPQTFFKLGWLSGPLTFTFTGTTAGEVNLFLDTK